MRRVLLICTLSSIPALACDPNAMGPESGAASAETEGEASANDAADRGPLGKGDGVGSCQADDGDFCGDRSDDGCWCDAQCVDFGDCCPDKAATCDAPPPPPPPPTPPPAACTKNIVVMGYWPPTNEMLRPWSPNPDQNPAGWQGENWRGSGYDVYAFFPEFPPDGNPANDPIGAEGAVGSPESDLRVDYQDTSADFWRIVDELRPTILLTTSRGGSIGWEIEAIEGGHGSFNDGDPAFDWSSDRHGEVQFPTQATVDPRSWDAMLSFRRGQTIPSALPMDAIAEATAALDVASVQIDQTGTSGDFLSGFLGLHGLYYHQEHDHNVAAGHIHVAIGLPSATAQQLVETTLDTLVAEHPFDTTPCP